MKGRWMTRLGLAFMLAVGCLEFVQPAQAAEPYGPYGYTPGAYDGSSDSSYTPIRWSGGSYDTDFGDPTYGPYGYTPGAYDNASPTYRYTRSYRGSGGSYDSDFGDPTYGPYGYTPGAYDNARPTSRYIPSYSYARPAARSARMQLQPVPSADDRTVQVRVRVPAGAKLWFNGEATVQRGEVRHFESPALQPGESYYYDLRATWQKDGKTVERTRHLRVRAGDQISVNLVDA
jgi:uncharacterized protein (TIGR03000 family)